MTTRDEELDDLEAELANKEQVEAKTIRGTPFIERPDTLPVSDGSLCWRDGARYCGADCVAFNTEELDEHGAPAQGPNKCLVLLYAGQQASAALSTLVVNRKAVQAAQDSERIAMSGGPPKIPGIGGTR